MPQTLTLTSVYFCPSEHRHPNQRQALSHSRQAGLQRCHDLRRGQGHECDLEPEGQERQAEEDERCADPSGPLGWADPQVGPHSGLQETGQCMFIVALGPGT